MSDIRSYSKEFMTNFIELYRSLPCLWKVKSKDYSDRNKKNVAYMKMVDILKEVEPDANRDLVVKKVNSLRSSYRKEKKKVRDSQKSGAGTEEIYEPSLWYYHLLEFLEDQDNPRQPVSNLNEVVLQDEGDIDYNYLGSPSESRPSSQCSAMSSAMPSPMSSALDNEQEEPLANPSTRAPVSTIPPRRLQKKNMTELDSVIYSVGKRIKESTSEDRHDAFGRNVANKLRHLPNDQRIYLEKVINDAIFEAELGNLNKDTRIQIPAVIQQANDTNEPISNTMPSSAAYPNVLTYNPQPSSNAADNFNRDVQYLNLDTRNISNYLTTFKP